MDNLNNIDRLGDAYVSNNQQNKDKEEGISIRDNTILLGNEPIAVIEDVSKTIEYSMTINSHFDELEYEEIIEKLFAPSRSNVDYLL